MSRYAPSRTSNTVSHAASPIVNDGKMMWNETVNANWSRDSNSAVRSIGVLPGIWLADKARFKVEEPACGVLRDCTHFPNKHC
jgi:hypothetical protein